MYLRALLIASVVSTIAACGSSPAPNEAVVTTEESVTAYTEAEVQALFDERCVRCHSAANDLLDLTNFVSTTVGVQTGGPRNLGRCQSSAARTRIARGDRGASLLFQKVSGTHDCGAPMPYDRGNKPLDATELEKLGLYIDALPAE
jgi:hypothetical protein